MTGYSPEEAIGKPSIPEVRVAGPAYYKVLWNTIRAGQVRDHGLGALAALESEHFDLVLMDLQMPEMDGFEAAAAVRAKERET